MAPPTAEGSSVQQRFTALVATFADRPDVTAPGESGARGFGAAALKVNGSIFAMLSRDGLVVKLPQDRVTALIQDGTGMAFTAGKNTPMRQWLTVPADAAISFSDDTWRRLATEALTFVARLPRR